MQKIIQQMQANNQIGTARNYQSAMRRFSSFIGKSDISFKQITPELISRYQTHLQTNGIVPNTISFYLRILRATYNRAIDEYNLSDGHPFRHAFTGNERTVKRAISLTEIKRIRELNLQHNDLQWARDFFMFLFYCRGMSPIDAAFLKKSNVKNNIISYRRHKTLQQLHINIEPPIKEIIDRYSKYSSPYLLPIIKSPVNTRKQYDSALRNINKQLKIIGKLANLAKPLTTYVSRHSWATLAKNKNIPINVISDALGHNSILTTQIYLDTIDNTVIDEANRLIINELQNAKSIS